MDCGEDRVEVLDNWEGSCTGVSKVSDRKREELRFHENEQSAAMWPATNAAENFFRTGIGHMPKFFAIKAKYTRAHPSLMTRSIPFTTGGSLIFVLQANKVTPKEQKRRDRFRYLHTKNANSVENTGHGLKFAATRRTYDAAPAVRRFRTACRNQQRKLSSMK